MMCARLYRPACVVAVEPDPARRALALSRGWVDLALEPGEEALERVRALNAGRCGEVLALPAAGRLDAEPLITHTYPLADVMEAYRLFEAREDGVLKVAVRP